MRVSSLLASLAVAASVAFSGCGGSDDTNVTLKREATRSPAALITSVPGVSEAVPMARRVPPPRVGSVTVDAGPFTDRVALSDIQFIPGNHPVARGRIRGKIDVSEFLVLEVRADFYDRSGRLVGSGRRVFDDLRAGPEDDAAAVVVRSSRAAPSAAAAVLSIPQAVNE